jgi:Meiotically Up-regulated Gene 113 (MUG113) protein
MPYEHPIEREMQERMRRWERLREQRQQEELSMSPDDHLDEIGWEIFSSATRTMSIRDAAKLAMDGNYRTRLRIRDDQQRGEIRELASRIRELEPNSARHLLYDTKAPEQIEFWHKNLPKSEFVYFIQSGTTGPVKIGTSKSPARRTGELQTGNPRELILRHVIPGDRDVEEQLHDRFKAARIRGEWFGRAYLSVILTFAAGLADEMVQAYDGTGNIPMLTCGEVRTTSEIERIRRDIERLRIDGHRVRDIGKYLLLDLDEVRYHLIEMSYLSIYYVGDLAWALSDPLDGSGSDAIDRLLQRAKE